jgi:hypothetical protein
MALLAHVAALVHFNLFGAETECAASSSFIISGR